MGRLIDMTEGEAEYLKYRFKQYLGSVSRAIQNKRLEEQKMGMSIEEHSCETCKWGGWYRNGYDITMMDDECGGCCSWNDKWKPSEEIEDGKIDRR